MKSAEMKKELCIRSSLPIKQNISRKALGGPHKLLYRKTTAEMKDMLGEKKHLRMKRRLRMKKRLSMKSARILLSD